MADIIEPIGYAIRNGSYSPAIMTFNYFDSMEHLVRYFTKEADMRDELRRHHMAEAVISIYPAVAITKEGAKFPLVVPQGKAYVHYRVIHIGKGSYRWYPLD